MCLPLTGLMKTMVNEASVSEYLENHQDALLSSRHPVLNHTHIHKDTPPLLSQTRVHIHEDHQAPIPPPLSLSATMVFIFFFNMGGLRVNCPSGGYQWTGQQSLLVSLVLNWQPGSDRLVASQEGSMAQDTIKIITFLQFACTCVTGSVNWCENSITKVCMCVCVCTRAWGGGHWAPAAGLGEDTARWGLFN